MKKILLTTTMLVGLSAVANAATEAGKMYVGADAGYQFSGSNDKLTKQNDGKKLTGFVGDIRFGYAIADNIRTDLSIGFSNPSAKNTYTIANAPVVFSDSKLLAAYNAANNASTAATSTTANLIISSLINSTTGVTTVASAGAAAQTPTSTLLIKTENDALTALQKGTATFGANTPLTVKENNRNIGLMANVYYDFSTGSAFTPYVIGGVGVSRSKNTATLSGTFASATGAAAQSYKLTSANKTGFTYAIGAGVGYEMSKDVVLDVGYKLTGRPSSTYSYKFADDKSMTIGTDTYNKDKPYTSKAPSVAHSFTAGVRFAF